VRQIDTLARLTMLHTTPPQSAPFFVVGAQRSGTTMLRLMLNAHSRLCVPFESRFIPDFHRRLAAFGDLSKLDNQRALLDAIAEDAFVRKGRLIPDKDAVLAHKPQDYAQLVHGIFAALAESEGKARWGDKTPSYVLDMDTLWTLFPGCRFIHLVRDGRDVALSMRSVSWGSPDLLRVAQDWRWKVTMGRKMGHMVPGHYLEIHFEDLVAEPRATLRRVCEFIGERFEDSMLDYPDTAVGAMPASSLVWHRSSVRHPDVEKVGVWRSHMTRTDQAIFDGAAGEALSAFGYPRTGAQRSLATRLRFARYALFGHA